MVPRTVRKAHRHRGESALGAVSLEEWGFTSVSMASTLFVRRRSIELYYPNRAGIQRGNSKPSDPGSWPARHRGRYNTPMQVLEIVTPVFGLILLGFVLRQVKFLNEREVAALVRVVYYPVSYTHL